MLLKSKDIAYLGVLLGLNQIFIILSSVIETNTILLFSVAALIVGIVIVEFGEKSGIVFYVASCILGFVLTFNKVEMFTYILFFGLYSIIKYYIEKKQYSAPKEIILKLLCFNISLAAMYFVIKSIIALKIFWWMIIVAEILFLVYDYAFGFFINHYMNDIRKKLKR